MYRVGTLTDHVTAGQRKITHPSLLLFYFLRTPRPALTHLR